MCDNSYSKTLFKGLQSKFKSEFGHELSFWCCDIRCFDVGPMSIGVVQEVFDHDENYFPAKKKTCY